MICPMMSRPSERGFERVECPQDGDCGWWTGEQCAVAAIAKGPKVFFGMDLAKEE